ncbi:hypothetical protein F3D3_4382 [Fusibacter sp. 3D3]|nr:hypothetical protein F3D3_4382 [Fusibacter sp. 3D3]
MRRSGFLCEEAAKPEAIKSIQPINIKAPSSVIGGKRDSSAEKRLENRTICAMS